MSRLSQLAVAFEIEEEDKPDLASLVAEIEHRLCELDGIEGVYADVGGATQKFSLVVEIEGQPNCNEATSEMVACVKQLIPRLVREPKAGGVWLLEQEDE